MGKRSWLKGACAGFLLSAAATVSVAQTFTSLASFNGTDGSGPQYMTLVQGTDGNYYGTTLLGGVYSARGGSAGVVFKVTPSGALTTLYRFCPEESSCPDGGNPVGTLVLSPDGNFYGTTAGGGDYGGGTVFKITPDGTLTTIHMFEGYPGEGASPHGGLVMDPEGNFWGTTYVGGANNLGTVYKITPGGTLTTLHSFNGTDGSGPWGELVQGVDGNFYGTTIGGGNIDSCGTVFRITPSGALTTLYAFCSEPGCPDGCNPWGALAEGADGSFYGVSGVGGIPSVPPQVFRFAPDGTLTTLHIFSGEADGTSTAPGLVRGTDGNFYGATRSGGLTPGGLPGSGTLFRITQAGILTTLYTFGYYGTEGSTPAAPPLQATDGNFYGTTDGGGLYDGNGTVFRISVGLGPFVETVPTSGAVGARVIILGNSLGGTTAVSFNGTAARFTVVSSSEIDTRVPKGAATGEVRVTTPKGPLLSNLPFRVEPSTISPEAASTAASP